MLGARARALSLSFSQGTKELKKATECGDEAKRKEKITQLHKLYDPELLKMEKKDVLCPRNMYNRGFAKVLYRQGAGKVQQGKAR